MFDSLDDTIVAVSSPPGQSPRALIRLSGPDALVLAATVFDSVAGTHPGDAAGHTRLHGRVRIDGAGSLPAELYIFLAPASYTRQDVAELHVVGSPPILDSLIERLTDSGARPAEPGEFTARAYFAGAIDLARVEGVAAVIHARTDAQLRASEALLHGRLSRRTIELRERLVELLTLLEAEIDFSEEPIEFIRPDEFRRTINDIRGQIDALLAHTRSVERLSILPEVLLIGRPNAGKSTLFNRLTGMERVIASAMAGTTRDIVVAPLALSGGEVMLLDSAGLTDAWGISSVDSIAVAVTRRALESADLIVLVVDACEAPAETIDAMRAILPERSMLVVLNKVDLCETVDTAALMYGRGVVSVSALTGHGVEELREVLSRQLFVETESHGTETLALSNRQRGALRDAAEALSRAVGIADERDSVMACAELLALEVREAMDALSLLTGEVATEELLGRIFAGFCIGK